MKTKNWIIAIIAAVLIIPVFSFTTMKDGKALVKNGTTQDSIPFACPYYNNANTGMMQGKSPYSMMNGNMNGSSEAMQEHYALMQQHHAAMQGMMMNYMGTMMNGQAGQGMHNMNSQTMHNNHMNPGNMHQGSMNGGMNHLGTNQKNPSLKDQEN